jgi:Mn-dependent DtxR family transcriptional regulator
MPKPKRLTLNQVVTVAAIRNYTHAHGHAPTLRELATLLDRSRGTTRQRLRSLQKKGVIHLIPRAHRTMEITPPKKTATSPIAPMEDDDLTPDR